MIQWIQSHFLAFFSFALLAAAFLLAFNLYFLLKIRKIGKKTDLFFSGKKGADLEEIILKQAKEMQELDKEIQELFEISNKINALAHRGLHKVGVIRFNPFKDIGGDQSFAIALLDGNNSGLVISSLHTREGTRIYTKPVIQGESKKYQLTEEEKQAITVAGPMKANKI